MLCKLQITSPVLNDEEIFFDNVNIKDLDENNIKERTENKELIRTHYIRPTVVGNDYY